MCYVCRCYGADARRAESDIYMYPSWSAGLLRERASRLERGNTLRLHKTQTSPNLTHTRTSSNTYYSRRSAFRDMYISGPFPPRQKYASSPNQDPWVQPIWGQRAHRRLAATAPYYARSPSERKHTQKRPHNTQQRRARTLPNFCNAARRASLSLSLRRKKERILRSLSSLSRRDEY